MMYFDSISIYVNAKRHESDQIESFKRQIPLNKGLTIIAGDNTSGKSTLAKCFYYILGVEEIIDGKQNTPAMDKSVYLTFDLKNHNGELESLTVVSSYVVAQLSNTNGRTITVERMLKDGHCTLFKEVVVYECSENEIKQDTPHTSYYLHYTNDHNTNLPFGYFQYLAKFAGLEIIKAPTKVGTYYDLYLKTLFALDFVEQTRGWTDYFAAIRGYNFIQPKQRIVEYALGLSLNENIVTYKQLRIHNEKIKTEWENRVKEINQRLTYNNLMITGLSDDVTKQKTEKAKLQFGVIGKHGSLPEVLAKMQKRITFLNASLRKTDDQRFEDYNRQLAEFKKKENQYNEFYRKYQDDCNKKDEISRQLVSIREEISRNENIRQVENLLNSSHLRKCPTCHREFDKTDDGYLKIGKEDIENNLRYLKTQRSFLEGLQESLKKSVTEKDIYLAYYKKIILQEKEKLNTAYTDVADPNYLPSEETMMEMTELKLKITSYLEVKNQIKQMIDEMWILKTTYDKNKEKMDEIGSESDETSIEVINELQKEFKSMLEFFNYDSNDTRYVSLMVDDQNSNYLYLPQALVGGYAEHLRSVSSASDFVRSVWAYYLALIKIGANHPGFLLFDEPCQHKINEADLKKLFEVCASIDKQIILFCSSEPKTQETFNAENGQKNIEKTNIHDLIKNIDIRRYTLYQMKPGEKAIS